MRAVPLILAAALAVLPARAQHPGTDPEDEGLVEAVVAAFREAPEDIALRGTEGEETRLRDRVEAMLADPLARPVLLEAIEDGPDAIRTRVQFGFGTEAYPEVVALYASDVTADHTRLLRERVVCTGVLAGDRLTILTAAHCLCEGRRPKPLKSVAFVPRYFVATVGGANLRGYVEIRRLDPQKQALYPVSDTRRRRPEGNRRCPGSADARNKRGDLAILTLKRPAPAFATPAALSNAVPVAGANAVVVGYGRIEPKGNRRPRPDGRVAGPVVVYSPDCTGTLADGGKVAARYGCKGRTEMVAGASLARLDRPTDACKADSGGPLYLVPSGSERSGAGRRLVGIVSRSTDRASECGPGSVYVRLSQRMQAWVRGCSASLRGHAPSSCNSGFD